MTTVDEAVKKDVAEQVKEDLKSVARKGWNGNVPPRDQWKVYKDGSPGFNRKLARTTLTEIKKEMVAHPGKRLGFRKSGLLGPALG